MHSSITITIQACAKDLCETWLRDTHALYFKVLPGAFTVEVDSMKTGGGAVGVGKAPLGTCSVCSRKRVLESALKTNKICFKHLGRDSPIFFEVSIVYWVLS